MYRNFVIALLAISVHGDARRGKTQKDKDIDYLNFVTKYNKVPDSIREMNKRKRRYQKSVEEIESVNDRAERGGL